MVARGPSPFSNQHKTQSGNEPEKDQETVRSKKSIRNTRIILGLVISSAFCGSQVRLMMKPSLTCFIISTTIFLIVVGAAAILFRICDGYIAKLEEAYTQTIFLFEHYEDELISQARALRDEPAGSVWERQLLDKIYETSQKLIALVEEGFVHPNHLLKMRREKSTDTRMLKSSLLRTVRYLVRINRWSIKKDPSVPEWKRALVQQALEAHGPYDPAH